MPDGTMPDGMPPDADSPAGKRAQLDADVRHMQNCQDSLREVTRLQAQMTMHAFRCLVEEGFSEQQALDLIKARGAML